MRPMHVLVAPCPNCGSFSVRQSRWRAVDFFALFRLAGPLRCQDCGDRFYGALARTIEPEIDTPATKDEEGVRPTEDAAVAIPEEVVEPDIVVRFHRPSRVLRALLLAVCDATESRLE